MNLEKYEMSNQNNFLFSDFTFFQKNNQKYAFSQN